MDEKIKITITNIIGDPLIIKIIEIRIIIFVKIIQSLVYIKF